jgi:hypothetical protein
MFGIACGGPEPATADSVQEGVSKRDTELVHEACDLEDGSAERLDANGDGRAEITTLRSGAALVCRAYDLNFDGRVDSYVYYDAAGKVRRRESDYDRDGRVDEVALFAAGIIQQKHRATTLSHKVDTWEFYNAGALARTERDSDGDEMVDQWWEYKTKDCPMIHSDVDGDGRPDPGATVDYCKETGYVPPERAQQQKPKAPSFKTDQGLPTEVETKPMEQPPASDADPQGKAK